MKRKRTRKEPLHIRQLRAYTQNLFEIFHRERMPMPTEVRMEQDPRGEPGVPLLICKFPDRTETWETVRILDDIVGWRKAATA